MYRLIPLGVCFWLLIKFIVRSPRIYTSWASKLSVSDIAVEDQQLRVTQLLEKYSEVFSKNDRDIGRNGLVKHKIKTEALCLSKQHLKEA